MPTIKTFEELVAWQKARELAREIYRATNSGRFARDFVLRDQSRRAVVSIASNIAEGFERGGTKEFIQFLSIARGSCGELRAQLYLAGDQGYLEEQEAKLLVSKTVELGRIISGFMRYLQKATVPGMKFG